MGFAERILEKSYTSRRDYSREVYFKRKLKKVCKDKELPKLQSKTIKDYQDLWKTLGKNPSIKWLQCVTSISGIESPLYAPEIIHHTVIEPTLNYALFRSYVDKNFYDLYLKEYPDLFPQIYLRGMDGFFYDNEYKWLSDDKAEQIVLNLNQDEEYILKPAIESGAGRNVVLLKFNDDKVNIDGMFFSIQEFIAGLCKGNYKNFVLQERLRQSEWFGHVRTDATNILRVFTYRSVKTNEPHILHSYFRYAHKNEEFAHHLVHGGLRQGINAQGILDDYAMDYFGNKVSATEHIDFFKSAKVPHYEEIVETAKKLSNKYLYHRLVGFDFVVDSNEKVRVLELNVRRIGMLHHQLIGGPLFGEYTHEVVDYCRKNKKSPLLYVYHQ